MTSISLRMESLYDIDTPTHVLANNRWIRDAVANAGIACNKFSYDFSFEIGSLHFTCDNEDEFKQHSFGQDVHINRYNMSAILDDGSVIFFAISPRWIENNNLYISSKNKNDLVALVDALNTERTKHDSASVAANNININVEGSQVGAISVGNNNVIETKVERETEIQSATEPKENSFWTGVWQTITSNLFWVVFISIVLFLLAYWGINQPDWLALQ